MLQAVGDHSGMHLSFGKKFVHARTLGRAARSGNGRRKCPVSPGNAAKEHPYMRACTNDPSATKTPLAPQGGSLRRPLAVGQGKGSPGGKDARKIFPPFQGFRWPERAEGYASPSAQNG